MIQTTEKIQYQALCHREHTHAYTHSHHNEHTIAGEHESALSNLVTFFPSGFLIVKTNLKA